MHALALALRQFRKAPGLTLTVVLTMALGIGANTAIFTLVHAVLLRSLPVQNPSMLRILGSSFSSAGMNSGLPPDGQMTLFSYALYRHLQETQPAFSQLAASQSGPETLTVRSGNQTGRDEFTQYVSGNYFSTLGVQPFAGRILNPNDDTPSASPVAVMSYATWQSDYGSDPGVVGRTFTFQNHPITIVGIAAADFYGDRVSSTPPAFWIPLNVEPVTEGSLSVLKNRTMSWLFLIGRVKPGYDNQQISAAVTTDVRQWLRQQPEYVSNGGQARIRNQVVGVVSGAGGIQELQSTQARGLYLLMAISALVLLVACANVANLLLARGTAQRADTALRMALGARRGGIVAQMLADSILLACAGGVAGLLLAYAGTHTILALAFPGATNLPISAAPSLPVLLFTLALSLLTGVGFGVVPAWITSHADPAEALRGANRSTRDRASIPQRLLVISQAALSLVLLVGASLLAHSLAHLQDQDFGFQTGNRYVVRIDPQGAGYHAAELSALYNSIQDRFKADPSIQNVGLALYSPLEGSSWTTGVSIVSQPPPATGQPIADFDRVNPGFFTTIGDRLIRGREFTAADATSPEGLAVVNEAFVRTFLPHVDPIGQHIAGGSASDTASGGTKRIIGVVADAKFANATQPAGPMYFTTLLSGLNADGSAASAQEERGFFIDAVILQFKTPPSNVDASARRVLADINPNLAVIDVKSLSYQVSTNFSQNRLLSRLATLFGGLALILAAVGLYGITSYQVSRRTSEIGVRMALGATRGAVLRLILQGALTQVGIGLAIGLPIALLGARSIASQLYGIEPWDPVSFVIAVGSLAIAAVGAGILPALRAANTEPVRALRMD